MFESQLSAPSVLRIIQAALVVAVASSPWRPRASLAPKLAVLAIASLVGSGLASAQPGTIVTVAGNGAVLLGDGSPATAAQLALPADMAVDGLGNLYIADYGNHRVRRVDLAGVITTVAGADERGYGGDGGPAPPVAAVDHGNDASSATRLALNSALDGKIETAGDEDWFRLETSDPGDVRVRTEGGLDTVGTLFDASNRQLASDDDGGDRLNFAIEATVAAGVYYVRVKGFD